MSNSLPAYDISCFTDIIGLSENQCDCFDTNVNWDESYSGVFLDKAEGLSLKMVDALKDCENENNLWSLMDTARTNAILQFVGDSNAKLLQKYEQARTIFNGNIGNHTYKNTRSFVTTYAGLRMKTANVVGGYIKLTNIYTFFSAVGTVDVTIYNNLNENLGTYTLNTADGKASNTVDILLPLWNENTTELEYIFLYTYNAANKPKDTEAGCTICGHIAKFDCTKPYYESHSNKLTGWAKWVMVGDIATNDIDFFDLTCTTGSFTNGLAFKAYMYCDLGKQFCFETPDKFDPNFIALAFAIQHLAAYKLIIDILASGQVNRYTMVAGETLNGLMALHKEKYEEQLNYLVENVDIKNTDCLKCRDNIKMGVAVL